MRETLKYSFILGLICFLASSVLALVNAMTEPRIKAQKEFEESQALAALLPQSRDFKACFQDNSISHYGAYDTNGQLNGFVIKTQGKGYSSTIEALVGLNLKLEIIGVKIVTHNETPGLGSRIAEPLFLARFQGKDDESLAEVQAISGATVSSSALTRSIQGKITELKDTLLQEAHSGR